MDVRDVEDSESVRDGSSLFVILGRLLRGGGGPGRQISMIQGRIKMKCTEVIRVVLHGGIGVRSFSLRRNRFPTGRCPDFGLCDALPVLWVAIAVVVVFTALLRVLCEEIDSQFGHFCRIISLIFRIDVLLLEFLFRERDKFRDEPEVLPCMLVIERVHGRCLVIMKGEPEEGTGTRRRRDLDR